MLFRLSLRSRILVIIACMTILAVGGTALLTLYTFRANRLYTEMTFKEILEYKSVQDMELALSHHKGLLSAYVLEQGQSWLQEMTTHERTFRSTLNGIIDQCEDAGCREKLRAIETDYNAYIYIKNKIIDQFNFHDTATLTDLIKEQQTIVLDISSKCQALRENLWAGILQKRAQNKKDVQRLSMIEAGAVLSYLILVIVLVVVLMRQVLRPVRMMARETGSNTNESSMNEVKSLSSSLHNFIANYDHTHQELARSREHLEQSEKMAMVGKLAAGVAHSIRNPFTSIKMRLFSLSRNLEMTEVQKEDFEVVSEEIGRIDNIVQNFLEFARPSKIRMQYCQSSDVVDSVLQILKHRLQAFNIEVKHHIYGEIPPVNVDPERLKEAIINLVINACEAMETGGLIEISESLRQEGYVQMLSVEVRDSGPGVSETIQDKILQPFFTTKEEGTGLGLSIVIQIIDEHHGRLDMSSVPGKGSSFTIIIPVTRNETA